jgi:secondary thiamine-phosphate synthase enzyme
MKVFNETLRFSTKGEIEFIDISSKVQDVAEKSGIMNGLVHVFAPHATGVLILTEYEPSLLNDIKKALERIAPRNAGYEHPSNAHAHIRSLLLNPDRTLPLIDGRVVLGTWQSLVFVEVDVHPRQRTLIIQVLGE